MQEWNTSSGHWRSTSPTWDTPRGMGRTPPASPAAAEQPTTVTGEGTAAQPQENGNLGGDDDEEMLIPLEAHSAPEEGSPHE
jgi:hypothetical protein